MSGTFSGIEMARRSMDYFRQGIETAGHNISNADVDGYSRQTVIASPTSPYSEPGLNSSTSPGQVGTGVGVDAITRMQDEFLNFQFRQESIEGGYWESMSQTLDYLEMFVGEPSSTGLSDSMDSFWNSMQEFQKNPDSTAARQNFLQQTDNMVTQLRQMNANFSEYRDALDQQVELEVHTVNDHLDQIAALNTQITKVQAVGNNPNDLLDERDLLVEELSRLIDISVSTPVDPDDGEYKIDLNGKMLVQGDQVNHLVLVPQDGNGGYSDVQIEGNTFDSVTDPTIVEAVIEREANEGVHTVQVQRTATETRWAIGGGSGITEAESPSTSLALEGAFTLQVGSCGVRCTSDDFTSESNVLLGEPDTGDLTEYSLRISSGSGEDSESIINIIWDASGGPGHEKWLLSSGAETTSFDAGTTLDLADVESFINSTVPDYKLPVTATVSDGRLILEDDDHSLISVTDLKGDLGTTLGYTNDNPVVTIDVDKDDSLQTIANKINCAYGADEGSPDSPGEWVHATVEEAGDGSFYLRVESNRIGEGYRINVGTAEGTSSLVTEKLGLVDSGNTTQVLTGARDARILVDGTEYLSTSNTFSEARLVSSADQYAAATSQEVLKGIRFSVNAEGTTSLHVERQIGGGSIEGLLESRDDVILGMTDTFDSFARTLADEINAVHYTGYGTGDNAEVTGTALFTPPDTLSGAAGTLALNQDVLDDLSLLGGAGDDGTGHSIGSGDGTNVLELIGLRSAPIFEGNSTTLEDYYSSFIADLGSKSSQAQVMNTNQEALLEQISTQIQSVSGVNTDEEMLDMVEYQQAYSAIARYVTVLDEMMDTIINGMGIVGR